MMYLLFRFHNIRPSELYWMAPGEKQLLYSLMRQEMDDRKKENEVKK